MGQANRDPREANRRLPEKSFRGRYRPIAALARQGGAQNTGRFCADF